MNATPQPQAVAAAPHGAEDGWYCVRSLVKHEHIAAASLRQIEGAEIYLPRLRIRKLTRRGAVWFTEAMFPNYLFARFDAALHLRHIRALNGVQTIVQFGDKLATVPDAVIADLRRHTGVEDLCVISDDLDVGMPVRIAGGSFHGLSAVVSRVLSSGQRVKVLLEFLGRATEFELARANVVPETASPLARK
ncbi:MAG: hypothetical protein HY301_12250 [Verrucomicrobia bacterium]|nr:hypothetical protein [Verrucomicrobiota bacterium]